MTRARQYPCEGSGHRVADPAMSGTEEKCPACHYWATPVRKYGEWQIRSHRKVMNDPYKETPSTVDGKGEGAMPATTCICGTSAATEGVMHASFCPASGYTERVRMNDYVGPPIMADLTWPNRCYRRADGKGKHLFGSLSGSCVACHAIPTVTYVR